MESRYPSLSFLVPYASKVGHTVKTLTAVEIIFNSMDGPISTLLTGKKDGKLINSVDFLS